MKPYAFGELFSRPTDLEDWIGDFCALRERPRIAGPSFPALTAELSHADWVIKQFVLLGSTPGARDSLRQAIAYLIATLGGREPSAEARDQIVGTLLDVAGRLEFVEVTSYLRHWARQQWLREKHVYLKGNKEVPLRRAVWTLLIKWGSIDNVVPNLTVELRQLALEKEVGTAQVCFLALGERDPAAALRILPDLARQWHEAYWTSVVEQFLRSVTISALLDSSLEDAWAVALGQCFYESDLDQYIRPPRAIADFDTERPNRLQDVLLVVGIDAWPTVKGVLLVARDGTKLEVSTRKEIAVVEKSTLIPERPMPVFEM
ncbi:MAG: hypothetical protein M3P06_11220 [Acidobacteriota bacterium]|nr:hypothetical protein [Acidobacteriota bacterium]